MVARPKAKGKSPLMAKVNGKAKLTRQPARALRRARSPRSVRPAQPAHPAATPAQPSVRLSRVAKGRKPAYFSDPAIDKLLWMTVTLMEELSVARERLDTVERLLERKRVRRDDIETFEGSAAEEAERTVRRERYVERVMRVLQAEIEELSGRAAVKGDADADAVEAVES